MPQQSQNKTVIYLVRHAEVYNPKRIIYVRLPGFGLSKLGYYQSQKLKEFFAKESCTIIYSSPLLRARRTAEIISNHKIKIYIRASLNEINFTKWQGLTYEERTIKEIEEYVKNPDKIDYLGETLEETQLRMIETVYDILHNNPKKKLIIVSHADPIILTVLYFMQKPVSDLNNMTLPNGSVYKLVFNDSQQCEKIENIQLAPAKKDWP